MCTIHNCTASIKKIKCSEWCGIALGGKGSRSLNFSFGIAILEILTALGEFSSCTAFCTGEKEIVQMKLRPSQWVARK
jgi:hypothetical protein